MEKKIWLWITSFTSIVWFCLFFCSSFSFVFSILFSFFWFHRIRNTFCAHKSLVAIHTLIYCTSIHKRERDNLFKLSMFYSMEWSNGFYIFFCYPKNKRMCAFGYEYEHLRKPSKHIPFYFNFPMFFIFLLCLACMRFLLVVFFFVPV